MAKATFTVGVFGLACCKDNNGTMRIMVNVRTDQARQLKLAKLPADSKVKIIDLPGGGVEVEDFLDMEKSSLLEVLRREVAEETNGCTIKPLARDFSGPIMAVTNNTDPTKATGNIAFWLPIVLHGSPQPTNEALDHPWVSRRQLETEYRCVGALGKAGRTGYMLNAAFDFYEKHYTISKYFSTP